MTDDEVEQLIHEIKPAVRGIARLYFREASQIEDLVQQHALELWTKRVAIDTTQNPQAFARTTMHFVCMRARDKDYLAHKAGYQIGGFSPRLEDPSSEEGPVEALEGGSWANPLARGDEHSHLRDLAVRMAFDKLPAHLWIVAWLVYGEGFLVSETARRLGLSRLLAEQRLKQATDTLQGLLKGWK